MGLDLVPPRLGTSHTHIACFEGEKKAQKNLPPAAGETPDPCHLSDPEMISYTFRHQTPGLAGGRRRRHGRVRALTGVRVYYTPVCVETL